MRGPREAPEPPPPEEIERRLHHVEAAIENLHAAEMHGAAERLEPLARRLRGVLERVAPPPPPPEIEGLHRRVNELEGILHRLAGRVERLSDAVEELAARR